MKPIIVGTDFSEGSYMALELAVDVANRLGCDIILIWARREKLLFSDEQLDIMTNLAKDKLQELCDKYQGSMTKGHIRWQITNGKVAPAIAVTAQRELATMIIIGTNGASGFEKYWIGSQAVRIVQDSPCPVLTVRQGYDFHKKLERIVVPLRVNANSRPMPIPARRCRPQPRWPKSSALRCTSSACSTSRRKRAPCAPMCSKASTSSSAKT